VARNVEFGVGVTGVQSSVTSMKKLIESFTALKTLYKEVQGKDGKGINLKVNLTGNMSNPALVKEISKSLGTLNTRLAKITATQTAMGASGKKLDVTINNTTNNTKNFNKVIKEAAVHTKNINTQLIGASIAMMAFHKYMAPIISDFTALNSSTFNTGIAAQMSITQIEGLNSSFLSMSKNMPITAKEMSDATDALIRTGPSFEESKNIISETSKLAVASGADIASTASVVTKVMVAMNMSQESVGNVLTSLHSTAIQTATDMNYLAASFKNVAAGASVSANTSGKVGAELEKYKQTVLDINLASIGIMGNIGVSAS